MYVAIINRRNRVVRQPFATLSRRSITPRTRSDHVIRVQRLQILTHLHEPRASFGPAPGDRLPLIYQLPTEDRRIVAIEHTGDGVSAGCEFLNVLAIKTTRFGIGVEEHRLLVV